jgi:hypothetical protein
MNFKLFYLSLMVLFTSCQNLKKKTPIPWDLSQFEKMNVKPLALPDYLSTGCQPIFIQGFDNPAAFARYDVKINGIHGGSLVNYFSNNIASEFSKQNDWPLLFSEGSLIIKEKIQDEGNEFGAMLKREKGYDTENGDWEYFYIEKSGKIHQGKLQSCIKCHKKASDNTYIYGYKTFR